MRRPSAARPAGVAAPAAPAVASKARRVPLQTQDRRAARRTRLAPPPHAAPPSTTPTPPSLRPDAAATGARPEDWASTALTVVVVGASGDLAKKKIYPALFALFYDGHLPPNFSVWGYARSSMTDAEFRESISRSLTCRVAAGASCGDAMERFLARCFYQPGQYGSTDDFAALDKRASAAEAASGAKKADRMFYLSIPPSVFTAAAAAATAAASATAGWTRVIVEKPFGRDSESYRALAADLANHLTEEATYRIDHYLGMQGGGGGGGWGGLFLGWGPGGPPLGARRPRPAPGTTTPTPTTPRALPRQGAHREPDRAPLCQPGV